MQKQAEAASKQATMKAKHLAAEVKRAERDAASKRADDGKLATEHATQTANVAQCERSLAALTVDDTQVAELRATVQREEAAVQAARAKCQVCGSCQHFLPVYLVPYCSSHAT